MTITRDQQFEVDGVTFGADCPMRLDPDGFTPGQADWRTQDAEHPSGDGGIPGRDFQGVATWGFGLHCHPDIRTEAAALTAVAELRSVWPAEELRSTPRAVTALRYRLAGRTRRVYGRPRRWTPVSMALSPLGNVPVRCDFAVFDPLHYDDAERSVTVDMTGTTNPYGISSPVRSPFAAEFGIYTAPSRSVVVDGDRPTWPVIEFTGGVNPWVSVAGWTCKVMATLGFNETVVVDTRPWVRSSTLNGALSPLSRGTRLQQMAVPPGRWPVLFGNDSAAGTPSVTVRWRSAHSSL